MSRVPTRSVGATMPAGYRLLAQPVSRPPAMGELTVMASSGAPTAAPPTRQVAAALAAAARHGLAGPGIDPVTGQLVDAAALRARLLEHVSPALADHGDTEMVIGLLRRLDDRGTGAGRQRALFTRGLSTPAFITALARATLSGYEPGRQWAGARVPAPAAKAVVLCQ